MYMKPGQRKIDIAPIARELAKNPPVKATPVMNSNLGWINGIVGKSKPVIDTARTRINSYKPQANLSYLNMLLKK